MSLDHALAVADLRVGYPTEAGIAYAVEQADFVLRPGRTLGVVGESGSGKSTVGKALMGLLPKGADVSGTVVLSTGEDLLAFRGRRLREARGTEIGIVFQEPMTRLDPLMRVSEHFIETLRAHDGSISRAAALERSLDMLRRVGIPPTRWNQYPHEFSGGMRQRIMIALALVTGPAVLIADESTTALDVLIEAQILELLDSVQDELGTAIILITHNLGIVAEACDDVAVMYAGRIVEIGPCERVLNDPQHPYTRGLLESTISLTTTELRSIEGTPPSLLARPKGCAFAPRCPSAMPICGSDTPQFLEIGPERRAACWLHAEESAV